MGVFSNFHRTFRIATTGLVSLAAISTLISCTSKEDESPAAPQEPKYEFFFNYDVETAQVGPQAAGGTAHQWLMDAIKNKQPIDYPRLTEAFKALHVEAFKASATDLSEMNEHIGQWSAGLDSSPIYSLKATYEATIESQISPATLDYLSSAVTVPHFYKEKAMQCYSGTSLFEIMYRSNKSAKEFIENHRVVIYEPGHVLPGYVLKQESGWRLYGIETTASGEGIVDFGPTKEISEAIRVVDANDFMVIEVIKSQLNPKTSGVLALAVLKNAAAKYDIPLDSIEAKIAVTQDTPSESSKSIIAKATLTPKGTWDPATINASPFSFGKADVPRTRIKRQHMDQMVRGGHPFVAPNSLAPSNGIGLGVTESNGSSIDTSLQGLVGMWVNLNMDMSLSPENSESQRIFNLLFKDTDIEKIKGILFTDSKFREFLNYSLVEFARYEIETNSVRAVGPQRAGLVPTHIQFLQGGELGGELINKSVYLQKYACEDDIGRVSRYGTNTDCNAKSGWMISEPGRASDNYARMESKLGFGNPRIFEPGTITDRHLRQTDLPILILTQPEIWPGPPTNAEYGGTQRYETVKYTTSVFSRVSPQFAEAYRFVTHLR